MTADGNLVQLSLDEQLILKHIELSLRELNKIITEYEEEDRDTPRIQFLKMELTKINNGIEEAMANHKHDRLLFNLSKSLIWVYPELEGEIDDVEYLPTS